MFLDVKKIFSTVFSQQGDASHMRNNELALELFCSQIVFQNDVFIFLCFPFCEGDCS